MGARQILSLLLLGISIIIIGVVMRLMYRYFDRHAQIRAQYQTNQLFDQEKEELIKLGFSYDSEVIKVLDRHALYQKESLDASLQPGSKAACAALVGITKQMLAMYIKQTREAKQNHISIKSTLITFLQDSMLRLSISLSEVEKQFERGKPDMQDYQRRAIRMKELAHQAVEEHKKFITLSKKKGLTQDHEQMLYAYQGLVESISYQTWLDKVL